MAFPICLMLMGSLKEEDSFYSWNTSQFARGALIFVRPSRLRPWSSFLNYSRKRPGEHVKIAVLAAITQWGDPYIDPETFVWLFGQRSRNKRWRANWLLAKTTSMQRDWAKRWYKREPRYLTWRPNRLPRLPRQREQRLLPLTVLDCVCDWGCFYSSESTHVTFLLCFSECRRGTRALFLVPLQS